LLAEEPIHFVAKAAGISTGEIKSSIPTASRSAFWRQRGPLHFESQSTSFSSHCLRIDAVVFLMRSEKSDHQNAIYVLNQGNQPKIVSFDIENHTTALQDARRRVRFLRAIPEPGFQTFRGKSLARML
jgi:hypothetical protein